MQLDDLATRAQSGDRVAFEALIERFEGPLLSFLRLRVPSDHDAEELAQDTFLRAWQNLSKYDSRNAFSTWLFTLGKRLAISRLRRPFLRSASEDEVDHAAGAVDPAQAASARDEHDNVWRVARSVLSPDALSAMWLRYAEDASLTEIAQILEKREATVRVILCRARSRLTRELDKQETRLAARRAVHAPRLDSGGTLS